MTTAVITELDPRPVDFSTVKFTAEQFERVCEANPDRSFELTAQGVLEVVPPIEMPIGKLLLVVRVASAWRNRYFPEINTL
jgi:Uma2 family endonuclease